MLGKFCVLHIYTIKTNANIATYSQSNGHYGNMSSRWLMVCSLEKIEKALIA